MKKIILFAVACASLAACTKDIEDSAPIPGKSIAGQTFTAGDNTDKPELSGISDALPGCFTVSPEKKVRFSKGNLKYQLGDTPEWCFFTNQYDCDPGTSELSSYEYVSLFTWGYGTWSTTRDHRDYLTGYGIGQKFNSSEDWGSQMSQSGVWRTLTGDIGGEWEYLLYNREVNGGKGRGKSYMISTIMSDVSGGVYGLILFPDDYTSDTVARKSYTSQQWISMESEGCVFLPAAGYRDGSEMCAVGTFACYWSSSAAESFWACNLIFDSLGASPETSGVRYHGCAVRLVTDVQ